jgi:ABC-type transporter Mla MlaB component
LPGSSRRARGEEMCRFLTCRHNLLGELARRPAGEAEEAMRAFLDGEWLDTCALDVADRGGVDDGAIAMMLGSTAKRVTQISAEALYRARGKIAADSVLSVEFADELAERKRH